jgi:predicted RNase H-like HicB family nuclease
MRYAVVVEKARDNYSAYVPDLPGCVATGATRKQTEREIRAAIEFHLDGLREDGATIARPTSACGYVEARPRGAERHARTAPAPGISPTRLSRHSASRRTS